MCMASSGILNIVFHHFSTSTEWMIHCAVILYKGSSRESMHNQYICRQNRATMSDGGRREENDPSLIFVLLCFIAPERRVRWQRQWTPYYLFWNSEKWRVSAPLSSTWTLINSHPCFYQKPIMSLIQSRIQPDISFNSSYSPIMLCWNNVSFISVAIDLLVFFVYTRSLFVSEWEFLEVLTQRGPGVEFQTLIGSDVVFIKLQTA